MFGSSSSKGTKNRQGSDVDSGEGFSGGAWGQGQVEGSYGESFDQNSSSGTGGGGGVWHGIGELGSSLFGNDKE